MNGCVDTYVCWRECVHSKNKEKLLHRNSSNYVLYIGLKPSSLFKFK